MNLLFTLSPCTPLPSKMPSKNGLTEWHLKHNIWSQMFTDSTDSRTTTYPSKQAIGQSERQSVKRHGFSMWKVGWESPDMNATLQSYRVSLKHPLLSDQ